MFFRHFYRINYVARARITMADNSFEAMTENLSAGGLLVRSEYVIPVGSIATLNFTIPNALNSSITVKGLVVRNDRRSTAFEFKSLDYETFAELKSIIKKKPLPV